MKKPETAWQTLISLLGSQDLTLLLVSLIIFNYRVFFSEELLLFLPICQCLGDS